MSPPPSKKTKTPSTSHQSKKKQASIKPIPPPVRLTSQELFGEDSDEEEDKIEPSSIEGKVPPIQSIFVNKVATGISKQVSPMKTGTHYIELKVYRSSDIENILPINRWRQAIVTLKCKTDADTDLWQHLSNVVLAARKEFRGVPNTFSSYFSMNV